MRITILDLEAEPPDFCDVEVALQRRASSPIPLIAAKWQKLLDLVRVLRADGLQPEARALIVGEELSLFPRNPANRIVNVRVRVDWQDYAPLRDGLPELHYRLQIERPGAKLSKDARTRSPEEAGQIIREALGWSR